MCQAPKRLKCPLILIEGMTSKRNHTVMLVRICDFDDFALLTASFLLFSPQVVLDGRRVTEFPSLSISWNVLQKKEDIYDMQHLKNRS